MTEISHAIVVPDDNFAEWYQALKPYLDHFERVVVIRSPGGNDLNPYRNVTAVNAPRTWMTEGPLHHIRRIYPQVVRVDVIDAQTPEALASVLQGRVAADDRYGEKSNADNHIDDRFVLDWPTDHKPMGIVKGFTSTPTGSADDNMGLSIASAPSANVLSSTTGKVTRQWAGDSDDELGIGKYVQVTTQHGNNTYTITYAGLSSVRVPLNTVVNVGDEIGRAGGDSFDLIVQQPDGAPGYQLPGIVDPLPMIYVTNLRVRSTGTGLRVRTIPVDGDVITSINPWDTIIPKEGHGRVLQKIGVEGEWIRINTPIGDDGYAAAWFMEAFIYEPFALKVNPVGVNLDQLHPLGKPDPSRLGTIGWVRFGYNVSNNTGSEDIQAAYDRYAPLAEKYVEAGYQVCFATSHQTYGEGKNEFWPWPEMNDQKWSVLIDRFADMMHRIAQQWAGKGLAHVWQVWNEQDAPIGAVASVPMTSTNYGRMLNQVVPAIKSADSAMNVITGGFTGGPGRGGQYARETVAMLNSNSMVDGIAFHPYGRGTDTNSIYAPFGHIDESVQGYAAILPDKPLWITEWGILDRPTDSPNDVANYATNFISYLKAKYPGKIACMIWYAWAQGMHNGYGIVDGSGQPRSPLTERFLQA